MCNTYSGILFCLGSMASSLHTSERPPFLLKPTQHTRTIVLEAPRRMSSENIRSLPIIAPKRQFFTQHPGGTVFFYSPNSIWHWKLLPVVSGMLKTTHDTVPAPSYILDGPLTSCECDGLASALVRFNKLELNRALTSFTGYRSPDLDRVVTSFVASRVPDR